MKQIILQVSRLLLGVVFLGAGINGYFVLFGLEPFIPTSPEAMVLFQFDYLLVVEKSLEVICGMLLLFNRFIPLTLAILAPIIANILLLHIFVDPSLLLLAVVLTICHGILVFDYWKHFEPLLKKRS